MTDALCREVCWLRAGGREIVALLFVSPRPQQTDPIVFLGAHDFVYLGEHLLLTGS